MDNNKFVWQKDEIQIAKNQCEFCKFNNIENENVCSEYPDGKPNEVITNKIRCPKSKDKDNFFDD